MKRFVNLEDQLNITEDKEFAFYCTVKGQFETFSGSQIWASEKEFKEDYEGEELQGYLDLIPEVFKF